MSHLPLNRLLYDMERESAVPRYTIAQKLDLLRCIQILRRCRRERKELYEYVRDHCYPLLNSTHLTQHEQWQYCMRVMTVNRYESLKDILNTRIPAK